MALIGTVLLWLLWILLGLIGLVLAVLLLALLIPVRVWLRYDTAGFALRLQVLFFRLQLLPKKKACTPAERPVKATSRKKKTAAPKQKAAVVEKKERPFEQRQSAAKAEKEPAAAKPAPAKPAKKQPDPLTRRILESLPSVLDMAGSFIGAVLRSLRFTRLEAIVPISGGAPDEVARKVGKANAWFYAIVAPLENSLHLKWKQVRIFPDYKEEYPDSLLLAGCIRGQLLPVVIAVLHLLIRLKKENIL